MNTEELKRIAEMVEKRPHKVMYGRVVHIVNIGRDVAEYFEPSLTGEDWQQAQACRVIVAAFNLPHETAVNHGYIAGRGKEFLFRVYQNGVLHRNIRPCPDLLSAACAALLQDGR